MEAEIRLVAVSLVTGIGFMFLYDGLRVFRMILPHGSILINVEDLIYFVFCGFRTFEMLYKYQDGEIRLYAVAAVCAGMYLYERIVGRKLRNCLKKRYKSLRIRLKKIGSLHKR